jgi:hypothetical protein
MTFWPTYQLNRALMFALLTQVRCKLRGRELHLRFVEHAAVTTLTFDDVEFTDYYTAPAEFPVKMPADRAAAASDEYSLSS